MHKKEILDFWNERAKFGQDAGTNDFMLKQLEERAVLDRVPWGSRILDIGCGVGSTLIRLCKEKGCNGVGLDYADNLLLIAENLAKENYINDKLQFIKQDVMKLDKSLGPFDCILTQRCLINLESKEYQKFAFSSILEMLKSGGFYYMIEAFNDGNRAINALRDIFHLEPMSSPWHNLFFELQEVFDWQEQYSATIEEVSHFASTYYFLSRVVYAKLANDKGENLRYDSDINKISLQLPSIGDFGATKLIVWRKK